MSNLNLTKEFSFIVNPIFTLEQDNCISTLITIGDYNILFDCGWNEKFSVNIKNRYEERLKNIKLDAIFLSNNYISYYGALSLIKSFPQNSLTKIYATTPIVKLGVYVMKDLYLSNLESNLNSLDHISNSKESLLDIFFIFHSIHEINYLQPIILKKELIQENNNNNENINNIINNDDDSLTIVSIPSGASLGGSGWTCSFRLFNFVYVPEYSIEQKIIADPFPYEKLKKINFFITDNNFKDEFPIIRKLINDDFDKKIRESLEQKKCIFVPTDNINNMLEMVIKFEKLLDEYKENYGQNRTDRPEYKILICSNCSNEIIEGIKSLTEFLGHKMGQTFFSLGDKLIEFEDVVCIKTINDYNNYKAEMAKKDIKCIILATFESLNIGLGYALLPLLLNDKNLILINIYKNIDYNSIFNNIIKEKKLNKSNKLNYITKKVTEWIVPKKNEENENNNENNENENKKKKKKIKNKKNKTKLVVEKKKLFNTQINDDYLSFNFGNRIRYTDYGIEFNKGELKIMKKSNESINLDYDSNFLNQDKKEIKLDIQEFKIPSKLETNNIEIEIKCEIFFYPLVNKIDFMSKKLIIEEINPKDGVILLGYPNKLSNWLKENNIKCYDLTNNKDKYEEKFKNNIIDFNYTSEDLRNLNKYNLEKSNQNIYSFDSLLLSIKTKRDKLIDISIADKNKLKKISENSKEKIKYINNEDENNKILTKNNLKLINIKHQLENESDIKLILIDQKLRSLDKTIEIYINEDKELILDGEFGDEYFKIKSKINDIYFKYIQDK